MKMNKQKIYIASSWKNELQQLMVKILLHLGHEVYDFKHPTPDTNGFQWESIDNDWKEWTTQQFIEALNTDQANDGFNNDLKALHWADVCLLLLPSGKSAHMEAGWMKGQGKKVVVVQFEKEQPELMYKFFDGFIININDFHSYFTINPNAIDTSK